jgi:microcystin-dependent protein
MDPFIGQITCFGFNWAPQGWAACNGQELPISQNQALFSLLGTIYGGNGVTTFKLPDLRGRVPLHQGQGSGLPSYTAGQVGGNNNVTLLQPNLPAHTHGIPATSGNIPCSNGAATTNNPVGAYPAVVSVASRDANGDAVTSTPLSYGTSANAVMSQVSVGAGNTLPAGGNSPVDVTNPYVVINWCIALEGIYPSRP